MIIQINHHFLFHFIKDFKELEELQVEEEEYFDLILKDLQEGEEGANLSLQDLQVEEVEADFILEYQEEEVVVFILMQKFKH